MVTYIFYYKKESQAEISFATFLHLASINNTTK